MKIVAELIEAIRNDRLNGASTLTRQSLEALHLAAGGLPSGSPDDYLTALTEVALALSQARPNMHSINHYMQCFLAEIKQRPLTDDLPSCIAKLTEDLIQQWETSRSQLIKAGASLISQGRTIFTSSYSSTIIASLLLARQEGKDFSLLIAVSRFQDGQPAYGANMASELAGQGITSTLIDDGKITDNIEKADMVVLGADTVLADGSVVNGYPSAAIAKAASAHSIPVYVLCEESKCSDHNFIQPEPGFEIIPAELISAVIKV
ncbi:MAG: hypothetical protein GXY34_09600 [Syntrophomonadaceae bacterium]|nr:hypothetical protein [Syntrophomonadaceae bacterium]